MSKETTDKSLKWRNAYLEEREKNKTLQKSLDYYIKNVVESKEDLVLAKEHLILGKGVRYWKDSCIKVSKENKYLEGKVDYLREEVKKLQAQLEEQDKKIKQIKKILKQ